MSSKMIISKKAFLSNINEWCWAGNGRCDLKDEDGAFIPEPVCETYTKWLTEWVERFNTVNDGFKVKLTPIEDEYSNGYRVERITPKRIIFPKWDDIEEVEYTLTEKEAKDAGEVSEESNVAEDEENEETVEAVVPPAVYTPTVYRITRKMAERVVPLLNDKGIYVENIQRHLNKDDLKRVVGVANAKGISSVYVGDERKAGTAHHLIPYNDEYQRTWGNQPIYGNIIIILGDKAYNELAPELKTTDISTITL